MQYAADGESLEPAPQHPRLQRLSDTFGQSWEVFNVLTSPLNLTTYLELDTVLNTEDFYNLYEIILAHKEIETVAHLTRPEGK